MESLNSPATTCQHCRHYTPQGRRGGMCQRLSVPVTSSWKSCPLMVPPFAPSWERLEEMVRWAPGSLVWQPAQAVEAAADYVEIFKEVGVASAVVSEVIR